jgi:hypothetical protein
MHPAVRGVACLCRGRGCFGVVLGCIHLAEHTSLESWKYCQDLPLEIAKIAGDNPVARPLQTSIAKDLC